MWPFNKKSTEPPEQKSLADPSTELEALFSGIVAGSTSISTAEALTVPAVSAAIRLISEAAASLEIKVRRKQGAAMVDATDHPAWSLLRNAANEWTSGFELVRDLTAAALVHDHGGLAYVTKVGGKPKEIICYRDGIISVEPDALTTQPQYKLSSKAVAASNIIHVRSPFSRSPMSLAKQAITTAKAMETYASQLFTNGARPGGVIETDKKVGESGVVKMATGWKAAFAGATNAGNTAVLWDGATFRPLTMTSTDSQFLENRRFQILEIARAFRVPPTMIFDLERATWSNGEQQGKEFLTYTLEPWLMVLEAAFSRALLTPKERKDHVIAFERDDLTRADIGARATAYSSLVSSRILNPNEAREWEGLAPYDGGNEFVNPAITPTAANDNSGTEQEAA